MTDPQTHPVDVRYGRECHLALAVDADRLVARSEAPQQIESLEASIRHALATRREVTPAQIALAWLVRQPGVTAPIVGVSQVDQLDQLVAALDVELDDEECGLLEELYTPHAVLGHS